MAAESTLLDTDDHAGGKLEDGIALCLSGGGYRAMVFHLGALIRLNETGLLKRLSRVSSVSGGSITAGVLGHRWKHLSFDDKGVADNLDIVVNAVQSMASTSIDLGAVFGGLLSSDTIADRVAAAYDKHLFGGATLQDLPDDDEGPRFVINATTMQSAALWRFSRGYMGDYRVGLVKKPQVRLAVAVAASSAFPPFLSPMILRNAQPVIPTLGADLNRPPYTERIVLSDGGVYDNHGLETAFKRYKTVLVSDGGMKIAAEERPSENWAGHSLRVLDVIDNQVRSLRRRMLIEAYQNKSRAGAYWGVSTKYAAYELPDDPLGCANRDPSNLAAIPTRLEAMPAELQNRLINWGYAVCDAALRKHMTAVKIEPPKDFPIAGGY